MALRSSALDPELDMVQGYFRTLEKPVAPVEAAETLWVS